jgi:hypothetical protein
MENKVWYKSTTVWFNLALALIAFIQSLSGIVPIPSSVIETAALVGNLLLRFKTNSGLVSASSQQ